MSTPLLIGMARSVYVRIALLAALEKGVTLERQDLDPFAEGGPPDWFLALNPMGKIPMLQHDEFVLSETAAITAYLDEAFAGPSLQPTAPKEKARLRQVLGIIDAYAYRPMVWGIYVAVNEGRPSEPDITEAISVSRRVLLLLQDLVSEPWLQGEQVTLADCHLAPVIGYLASVPPGAALLKEAPKLQRWFKRCRARQGWSEILDTR